MEQNRLIAALPDAERFGIVRRMEPVDLAVRAELVRTGASDHSVYFPTAGLASFVSETAEGGAVACAAVGVEGWLGAGLFAGLMPGGIVAIQQIAGAALRLSGDSFREALRDAPVFAASVERFSGLLLASAMQTAACNRLHGAVQRCARWVLFTCQRVGSPDIVITHEFLAQMLGASRSSLTDTMTKLERKGLIARGRAHVVVRNAEGLAQAACECHEAMSEAYKRYTSALGEH